jgi:hypothetical protein
MKVFNNVPEGRSPVGKPGNRWMNDVENDIKKNGY